MSYAVVHGTLKNLLKISSECGKQNIAVTCNLAIAKLAFQIQEEKSREFDNIFVVLGSFHIELAYFNACEKVYLSLVFFTFLMKLYSKELIFLTKKIFNR